MPEFFLELFSEEIPARMQKDAAERLAGVCWSICGGLSPENFKLFYGPRRIAVSGEIAAEKAGSILEERGPRDSAPEQALTGFLRKHNAERDELVAEGGYYVLRRNLAPVSAKQVLATWLPRSLENFTWPKSMRWGNSGNFTWVRPLRRITALLDGEVIPLTLGPVTSGNLTEGHRLYSSDPIAVSSAAMWEERLREHCVLVNHIERRDKIVADLKEKTAVLSLAVVNDEDLLDEVAGLVEWPVVLIGQIDHAYMDLPPEVRELSMKVNQKYFAIRDLSGAPAPYFAFVANLEAHDGGASIIAGNERVLRARLADARYFWDQDRKTSLEELLPQLTRITFHAKIGTQHARALRLETLSGEIAESLYADGNQVQQAKWAARWCKADLVTGMVGEFPELQGIMGGYYAELEARGSENGSVVGAAIKMHYRPKGPSDAVPIGIVAVSVALADKLDTLREFFAHDERPTGSSDPYALRRCALGVIRIILENDLRLNLKLFLNGDDSLFDFIIERLRVKLRNEGKRFDILDAVLAAGSDDDLLRLMKKVDALTVMLGTEDGKNLIAAFKRAANILRIEAVEDTPDQREPAPLLFIQEEENELYLALVAVRAYLYLPINDDQTSLLANEDYQQAMTRLASLRPAIDAFFENVTVNVTEKPELRLNRLRLLARFRDTVNQIADFSKIEG